MHAYRIAETSAAGVPDGNQPPHAAGHDEAANQQPRRFAAWALLALAPALIAAGCHRAYYREEADRDAYELIEQKADHPQWPLDGYTIELDPRSRMFNPFDPDRQPMPPDDPASHQLMHRVDKKHGYPHWHANGDTSLVENPDWLAYLPLDEEGVLVLDAQRAVELAMLHSRDYQQQLETLYLSALDVSFERFRFDTQFFGGYALDYRADGPLRNPGLGSQSVLTASTFPDIRAEKLFATGSELVVGFANSLVWQFSGPDSYRASTLLDFTLIQPLLRNAGRDRVLERLTLSERTLLANVRQMERYQRGFYVEIVTGRSAGSGPSRRGGVFGAGLEGFTGLGSSVFGRFSAGGAGGGGTTGGGQAGGFMGLLQSQQEIRNQQDNLNSLRSNYFRLLITLQELLTTVPEQSETIVRQRLQVAQARSAVLNADSRLINAQVAFQSELDSFKVTLGLPPNICVRVEDDMLERVALIDPAIRPVQDQVSELQQRVGDVILELLVHEGVQPEWDAAVEARLSELRVLLDEIDNVRQQLMEGDTAQIHRVREDGLKLGRKLRQALETALADAESQGDAASAAQLQADLQLLESITQRFAEDPNWLERLSGFNLLRDSLSDTQQIQDQLARGGMIELDWVRTDSNPATRDLYRQQRAVIETITQGTPDQQTEAIAQLNDALRQEQQRVAARLQEILDQNPWLAELDSWRISPDDVEEISAGETETATRRLKRLFAQFVDTMIELPGKFNTLPDKIQEYQRRIDALIADGPSLTPDELVARFRQDISPAIPQELVDLSENVLLLSLMQARDRAETVALVDIDLHPAAALEIARRSRRDWMNARAALVDSWRLIEFNADNLESGLDIVFSGDIQNRDDNPFSLDANTGQLRVGLQFDAPLTRLSERNTYRESLIEYQQQRREYYAYQDAVYQGLRATLRTIELNEQNFEIRREAVRAADQQIELNEDIRKIQEANRQPSGPTAARDAVQALSDLLTAQNDFLSVWITYEVLRRTLDFDLGTMQLDSAGMWIDPGNMGPEQGYPGLETDLEDECWPGPGAFVSVSDGPCCAQEPVIEPVAVEQTPLEPLPQELPQAQPLPAPHEDRTRQ